MESSTLLPQCEAMGRIATHHNGRVVDGLCVVCREPLKSKRQLRYCSNACGRWFPTNHSWTDARAEALRRNRLVNFVLANSVNGWTGEVSIVAVACCSRCKRPETPTKVSTWSEVGQYWWERRDDLSMRLEVDHILPMNGGSRTKTCMNHQDNLRVVCHECHLEITKEQRRAGLIGTTAPKRY